MTKFSRVVTNAARKKLNYLATTKFVVTNRKHQFMRETKEISATSFSAIRCLVGTNVKTNVEKISLSFLETCLMNK